MFENIGGKIKALAKVICWIGIIACVVIAIVMFVQAGETYYRGERTTLIITGILVMTVGSLLSWVSSFVLYGFGELVENSTYIAETMEQKEQGDYSGEWFCKKCGYLNKAGTTVCNKCGTEK